MARRIQSGQPQAGIRAFLGLLATAVFWLAMAIVLPIQAITEAFSELAPYSHWAPILFYALAFWSVSRAVRALQQVAGGRLASLARSGASGAPAGAKGDKPVRETRRSKPGNGFPVSRTPTVQHMR